MDRPFTGLPARTDGPSPRPTPGVWRRPVLRAAAALLPALALTACESFEVARPRACPRVSVPRDTSYVPDRDGRAAVYIGAVASTCAYATDVVTVSLTVPLASSGGSDVTDAEYMVATVAPTGAIIGKRNFPVRVPQAGGIGEERLELALPLLVPELDVRNYLIVVGFQLTDEQLERNRSASLPADPAAFE